MARLIYGYSFQNSNIQGFGDLAITFNTIHIVNPIFGHTDVHSKTGLSESELALQKALRETERETGRE